MRHAIPCLLLAMLLAAHAAFAMPSADAVGVASAIEQRLHLDGGISADRINAEAEHSIIILSGTVNTVLVQRRAAWLAKTFKGVRAVVNLVEVAPAGRPAGDVQGDVSAALAANPATAGRPIRIAAIRGTVTLEGSVQSAEEKRLAELLAAGVTGVDGVENSLVVATVRPRPARAIEADAEQAMAWDPWLSGRPIVVAGGPDDEVTLSGRVGSDYEKQHAAELAKGSGVRSVVDHVRVDPALLRPDEALSPVRPDAEITTAIVDAFHADPRLRGSTDALHVEVAAAGRAVLSGTAASYLVKRAAAEDAKNAVGVRRVVDRAGVDPSAQLPDPVVRDNVRQALLRDPDIALDDVEVAVSHGQVLLRGVVPTDLARKRATGVVAEVDGVTGVVNRLTVLRNSGSLVQAPQPPDRRAK